MLFQNEFKHRSLLYRRYLRMQVSGIGDISVRDRDLLSKLFRLPKLGSLRSSLTALIGASICPVVSASLFITFSVTASAQERLLQLDPVQARLYRFIVDTQNRDQTTGNRSLGGWQTISRFEKQVFSQEPNAFITVKNMSLLHEVSLRYELPRFADLETRAIAGLMPFLSDASATGEPAGTIAFWPLQDFTNGRRGPWRGEKNRAPVPTPFSSIPNDFDSSSLAVQWFMSSQKQMSFVRAFATTIGNFRDIDRFESLRNDTLWKKSPSGAFMIWAEPDRLTNSNSRIPGGSNGVDCVVNLNALTALARLKHLLRAPFAPPLRTARGEEASCRLIVEAMKSGSLPQCSIFYDRASQVFWAYAQALTSGVSCLEGAASSARWRLLTRAYEVARAHEASSNGTEVAELLGSIKLLYPFRYRPERITRLTSRLEAILRAMVNEKGALVTEDSASKSRGLGPRLDWYAPSYSATISLLALSLP